MKTRTKAWIVFFVVGWLSLCLVLLYEFGEYIYDKIIECVGSIERNLFKKGGDCMLAKIYEKYKSGCDKGTVHSYIEYYEELFRPLQNEPITLLEIGVYKGASLRMWADYFTKGSIVGVDIRPPQKIIHSRIKVFQLDATEVTVAGCVGELDIVIDDGSHELHDQLGAFAHLWPKVKPGGLYIIEDCRIKWKKDYKKAIPSGELVDRRDKKGHPMDILFVVRKP